MNEQLRKELTDYKPCSESYARGRAEANGCDYYAFALGMRTEEAKRLHSFAAALVRRIERLEGDTRCAVCGEPCSDFAADGECVHQDCDDACGEDDETVCLDSLPCFGGPALDDSALLTMGGA